MNASRKLFGHQATLALFQTALDKGRLASSFLLVGPPGIGKRAFADYLAQGLLCQDRSSQTIAPCGQCPACQQVAAQTHPDLHVIVKPPDRATIPIELLIGDREHRMRSGLCHEISMKPMSGSRKIAIIDDADLLNEEGANCLLKTLEEPPRGSLLLLISDSEQRQLPTIRSRCQIVRLAPLSIEQVTECLAQLVPDESPELLGKAAAASQGSVQAALDWLDHELHEFRDQLFRQLESQDVTRDNFAKTLVTFVESVGTQVPARRRRLDRVLELTIEFYRMLLKSHAPTAAPLPAEIEHASHWCTDPERAADCLQTCMNAQAALHANANVTTLIESWLIELGQVARGETQVTESFYASR